MKVILNPIDFVELEALAENIGGFYVKVVVDLKKEILAAGAKMHVDEEELLLRNGSNKNDLWGGGYDLDNKEIKFDSIINNRPIVNNSSEILDFTTRDKFTSIVKHLLNI